MPDTGATPDSPGGLTATTTDGEDESKESSSYSTSMGPPSSSSSCLSSTQLPFVVLSNGVIRSHNRPTRESVLQRLSEALLRRSLIKIDLSQRGLQPHDARLVKMALLQNAHVTVLKLGYNHLGDEGTAILSTGIAQHSALESLDLGFNDIGDEGCQALAAALCHTAIHTLYLAGNLIGQDGAMALADLIRRRSSTLKKLYLTGNKLLADGVRALTAAITEKDDPSDQDAREHKQKCHASAYLGCSESGMEELFLGGTDMGIAGCHAVAAMLARTTCLRVLSLPNCDFGDDAVQQLSCSIKQNRQNLPLESLQLSFNRITCSGMEYLSNAVWGLQTLKELLLDNNRIADLGIQHLAGVLPTLQSLETLDIGFNRIKTRGIMLLMKAVADSSSIKSLSVSGNAIDTSAAKAITYAVAYSPSLTSLSVVRCDIKPDCQRQIVAGIVSNSRTALRALAGFAVGPVIVTLGFPSALEHWSNEQVFNFIHLMWARGDEELLSCDEEEKNMDPLNFLDGGNNKPAPLEASIVVELAKKTFSALVEDGVDVFSRLPGHPDRSSSSPLAGDTIMFESLHLQPSNSKGSNSSLFTTNKTSSFVAPPEMAKTTAPDPARKKRIVEWLCKNIPQLNKIAQQPFSSSELGRLHQYYFSPVVNESGGALTPVPSSELMESSGTSVPGSSVTSDSDDNPAGSENALMSVKPAPPGGITSLPMLKRKVSYRFLGDAALASAPRLESGAPRVPQHGAVLHVHHAANHHNITNGSHLHPSHAGNSVNVLIERGPVSHTLPPKSKRARRNRSRISFLPRIKAKLDSYLDVCHEKALKTMRQLYFVERAILSGQVNPIDPTKTVRSHLCGDFATDAEMIIVDMI